MASAPKELREIWVKRGDEVVDEGDAATIEDWLANKLDKLAITDGGWRSLYRHKETGRFWELTYPHSSWHGGGPRVFRELDIDDQTQWS